MAALESSDPRREALNYLGPARVQAVEAILRRRLAEFAPLPVPRYAPLARPDMGRRIMLAVETFKRHMTDEGWQLQLGLERAGYDLWGRFFPAGRDQTDVSAIIDQIHPDVAVIQDKREWDPSRPGCFDKRVGFTNFTKLVNSKNIFRLSVQKDLLFDRAYFCAAHHELQPHAVIHYYHPALIRWLAPWLWPAEEIAPSLIRTWHSLDPVAVPRFDDGDPGARRPAVLSGALNAEVYPLRGRIAAAIQDGRLPGIDLIPHPGYHAHGPHTPGYLRTLAGYRVAICTSSIMGFALRKLIEATACGCIVITDLPDGEAMPAIDGNLRRVSLDASIEQIAELVDRLAATWDPEVQRVWAAKAVGHYSYIEQGLRLARDIENVRLSYAARN